MIVWKRKEHFCPDWTDRVPFRTFLILSLRYYRWWSYTMEFYYTVIPYQYIWNPPPPWSSISLFGCLLKIVYIFFAHWEYFMQNIVDTNSSIDYSSNIRLSFIFWFSRLSWLRYQSVDIFYKTTRFSSVRDSPKRHLPWYGWLPHIFIDKKKWRLPTSQLQSTSSLQ